jgi:peroxiredoxin Q/BCP
MKLQVGQSAPHFQATDQDGQTHSLADFAGQWLLLYFYPKDDTPGCTQEACAFRDLSTELKKFVKIVGVSSDSVESHQQFAEKYHLHFPLLADPEKKLISAYGANGLLFPNRISFLISPEGKLAKIYEEVDVTHHAEQILEDVQVLIKTN